MYIVHSANWWWNNQTNGASQEFKAGGLLVQQSKIAAHNKRPKVKVTFKRISGSTSYV